jgi:hypothetical protein
MKKIFSTLILSVSAAVSMSAAQAQTVYGGGGALGLYNVGYSHAVLGKSLSVRVQHASGLNHDYNETESDGSSYTANLKYSTTGLFADWYPAQGSFRVVGGVSFNNVKLNMSQNTGTTTIGNQTVTLGAGDYYRMTLDFPKTTPYLGIGFGHNNDKGWGGFFDFGFLIGKFKVKSETNLGVSQDNINAEENQYRDDLNKISILPVIAGGVSYRF